LLKFKEEYKKINRKNVDEFKGERIKKARLNLSYSIARGKGYSTKFEMEFFMKNVSRKDLERWSAGYGVDKIDREMEKWADALRSKNKKESINENKNVRMWMLGADRSWEVVKKEGQAWARIVKEEKGKGTKVYVYE